MTHDIDPKQNPKKETKSKESFSKDDVNTERAILNRLKSEKPELFESLSAEVEEKEAFIKNREDQEEFAEDASDAITREAVQLEVSQLRNDARDEFSHAKEKLIEDALISHKTLDKWKSDLEKELDQLTTDASLIKAKRDNAINQWDYDKTSHDKQLEKENKKIDIDLERESKILKDLEASEDQVSKRLQFAEDGKKEVAKIREQFAGKHKETVFTILKELESEAQELYEKRAKVTKKLEGVNDDISKLVGQSKEQVSQKDQEINKVLEEQISAAKESPKALRRGPTPTSTVILEAITEETPVVSESVESTLEPVSKDEPGPQIMSGKDTIVPVDPEVKQVMDDAERSLQEPVEDESTKKLSSENTPESQPTETREIKIEDLAPKNEKKPEKELVPGSAKYYLEYLLMEPFVRPVMERAKTGWDNLPTAVRAREVILDKSTYSKIWARIPSFKELKIKMEFGDKKVDPDATQPLPIPLSERVASLKQKLPDWVTPKNVGAAALATVFGIVGYVGSANLRANKTEIKPYPVNELRLTSANVSSLPAPVLTLPQAVVETDKPVKDVKKKQPESAEQIVVVGPEKPKKDEKPKQIQVPKSDEKKSKTVKRKKKKPESRAKKRSGKKKPKAKPQVTNSEKAYNWLVNSWFESAIKDLSAKKTWFGKSPFEKAIAVLGSLKSSQPSMTTEQMAEVNKALRKARKRIKGKKGSKLTNSDVKSIAKALRKQNGITKSKKKPVLAKAVPKDKLKAKLNNESKKKDKKKSKIKPKVEKKKKKEVKAAKPKDEKSKKKSEKMKKEKKPEKKKDNVPDLKSELAKQVGDFGTAVANIQSKSRRELGKNVFIRLKEANRKADAKGEGLLNNVLTRYFTNGYPTLNGLEEVGKVSDKVSKSHDDRKKAAAEQKRKKAEKKAEKRRKKEETRKKAERKRREAEKKKPKLEKKKPASIPVTTAEPKPKKPELPPMSPETASLLERLEKAERSLGIIN